MRENVFCVLSRIIKQFSSGIMNREQLYESICELIIVADEDERQEYLKGREYKKLSVSERIEHNESIYENNFYWRNLMDIND